MSERQSRLKRGMNVVGSVVAVPIRLADFVLGVPHSTEGNQTVRELQRLADMRHRGELTDEEYRRAKEKMLGGS